jgi:N-acetylglucosamine kinase-like BadF-type ATPase
VLVRNDSLAMLRAGTDSDVAIALICGAGVNCVGVATGGRRYRFPALGDISGDWGGGYDIGLAALTAAVRAEDGRGPRTALAHQVPLHFGLTRPSSVVSSIYAGRIDQLRLVELPPLVFAAADEGDAAAGAIIDRLAVELVAMVTAVVRRLRLRQAEVEIVLGGGVLTAGHPRVLEPLTAGALAVAPRARLTPLRWAPVSGAALIGFAELGTEPAVDVRRAVETALRRRESR